MTNNLGWFKLKGFLLGIFICLVLGILIYRRFDFSQQPKVDDTTFLRVNELQRQLTETRSKVDALEDRLNKTEVKLRILSSKHVKHNGKP